MDTVTLSKQNRLYWLGRYSERVYTTIEYMKEMIDRLIDGLPIDYRHFCEAMGIPCDYQNAEDFIYRYLFDASSPYSVRSSVEAMLGNGMVLRETISTPTLAYLQMAQSAMTMAVESEAPELELQWVQDDIMAFRGSFDGSVDAETSRNITKTGGLVEHISLMLRLDYQTSRLDNELKKLLNRLYKTGITPNEEALAVVAAAALEEEPVDRALLLQSVEGLFQV